MFTGDDIVFGNPVKKYKRFSFGKIKFVLLKNIQVFKSIVILIQTIANINQPEKEQTIWDNNDNNEFFIRFIKILIIFKNCWIGLLLAVSAGIMIGISIGFIFLILVCKCQRRYDERCMPVFTYIFICRYIYIFLYLSKKLLVLEFSIYCFSNGLQKMFN